MCNYHSKLSGNFLYDRPSYADKTSLEICVCPYWLQLFVHKLRNGLVPSLKVEDIFLVQ